MNQNSENYRDKILLQQSVAIWLIENTSLTFEQISQYCSLHLLTIEAIADGEINVSSKSPIAMGIIDKYEIERCVKDSTAELIGKKPLYVDFDREPDANSNKIKLTSNKYNYILYFIQNYPYVQDKELAKTFKTKSSIVNSIRLKTKNDIDKLIPVNPLDDGFLNKAQFKNMIDR